MSGNTPPEQNDKSLNDIVISSVKPKSNLKPRREGKFTPKTLKKQNADLGNSDDKEETQININSLKEKIDKILQMVSGDFAASIDKVLQLIENLKKQLKDKDNKCAECSKLINDAENEVQKLQKLQKLTEYNFDTTNKNEEEVKHTKEDIEKYLKNLNQPFDKVKDKDTVQQLKKVLVKTQQVLDEPKIPTNYSKTKNANNELNSEENKDVETQNIELQDNEKECQDEINEVNKTVEELTKDYELTSKEKDNLIIYQEELVKSLNIKKMLKDTKTRITNILTVLLTISADKSFGSEIVTRSNIKYFNKLKLLLRELKKYYIENSNTTSEYQINNEIKENITLILKFYKRNFKISNPKSKTYTDIDIEIINGSKINMKDYNIIINKIEIFNKYLDNSIIVVTNKINENRKHITRMTENIKNKNKRKKTGGSHNKRNKTNKIKKKKSKKLKGKMCKKNKTIKRKH